MTKRSADEYLVSQHPQLLEMAKYYEELGLDEPLQWAHSEMRGEASVSMAALVYGLLSEVCDADDHRWIERVRAGELNLGNSAMTEGAVSAIDAAADQGIELSRLTPLIRAIQAEVVRNIAALLDQGPRLIGLPLPSPAKREAGWELWETKDGIKGASTTKRIAGLHAFLDGSGRI